MHFQDYTAKKVKIIFIIFPFAHCGRTKDSSPGSRASKEAQIPYVLRNFHERNARIFFRRVGLSMICYTVLQKIIESGFR